MNDEIEALKTQVKELQVEQEASLHYIAAVVAKAAGVGASLHLTAAELRDASLYALERADMEDGSLILRAMPQIVTDYQPVLAKAHRPLIVPPNVRAKQP